MILLDTNVISELMKAAPDLHVLNWLDDNTVNGLFISSISHAEIALGIALLPTGKRQDALALAAAAMFSEDFSGMSFPFDQGSTGHLPNWLHIAPVLVCPLVQKMHILLPSP
jgi:hypothetical protein